MGIDVLRIKIYQPQAHYRIPFTYQRRHTYPIPPYSTVIGLLCNLFGIRNYEGRGEPCENESCDCNYHKLKNLKISICGRFESKSTEYTWFRNLNLDAHNKRFGVPQNRYVGGQIEHIGGQFPVRIDILNEVYLWIYLYHEDENFLEDIKQSFENPSNRIDTIHLGRAEDWIVIDEIDFEEVNVDDACGDFEVFIWVPENIYLPSDTSFDFNNVGGLIYRIPTFYRLGESGAREFNYENVKLSDGLLYGIEFYYDESEDKPIFLLNNTE